MQLNLISVLGHIDQAVICLLNEEHVFVERTYIYISLVPDYHYDDIHEFYYSKSSRVVLATGRGIPLAFAEWDTLKNIIPEISTDFPILVSCKDNPNHQNRVATSICNECNPLHNEEQ